MEKIFRLYIDESGDHSYGKKEVRKLAIKTESGIIDCPIDRYPELEKDDKRYLGITGCIIEQQYYRNLFQPKLEEMKRRHFTADVDEAIILHREDIINKRHCFWRLRDPAREETFNNDLLTFLQEAEYTVISVVIDKKAHIERYREYAHHPYHFCIAALLERYCGFLHFFNAKGDVMAESRGGTEDNQLKESYRNLYEAGTQFRRPEFFQNVLTSKEIKIKQKTANIAGLQLSDLIAHPLKREILQENDRLSLSEETRFGGEICGTIQQKLNRQLYSGKIYGYGKVFIK